MERIVIDIIFVICGFLLGVIFVNSVYNKKLAIIRTECERIQRIINDMIEEAEKEEERNDWK